MLLPKQPANQIGLIGHTIINYPSPEKAEAAVKTMCDAGVALIELQIPFSEPMADGPVFMRANHEAIAAGVTVEDCFAFMRKMTTRFSVPMVFMTYANIVFKCGFENFVKDAIAAGAKGAIVPDLPFDYAEEYLAVCKANNFAAIQLVPPNITDTRLEQLLQHANGFVYAVARAGVTGAKTEFGEELANFLQRIRRHTDLPIAVGFGIASAADVNFLKPYADYAIVGSQALRVLSEKGLPGLQAFWQELQQATQ